MDISLRFGKLPPKIDYRTLLFGNYLKEDIPEPPASVNLIERVITNLKQHDISTLFPMYDNNKLGDCTVAGAAHGLTVYHGMISQLHIPLLRTVVKIYNRLSEGIDSGLYLIDVIRYWRSVGLEDSKIFAYTSVNSHNRTHVKQAINLFGGLLMGFQCSEKTLEEFKAGVPWEKDTLINAGHAVYVTGYDDQGVEVLTWGSKQRGTWDWWFSSVDEAYALLPPEAQSADFAPGFDFERLKKDLTEISGL